MVVQAMDSHETLYNTPLQSGYMLFWVFGEMNIV